MAPCNNYFMQLCTSCFRSYCDIFSCFTWKQNSWNVFAMSWHTLGLYPVIIMVHKLVWNVPITANHIQLLQKNKWHRYFSIQANVSYFGCILLLVVDVYFGSMSIRCLYVLIALIYCDNIYTVQLSRVKRMGWYLPCISVMFAIFWLTSWEK